MSDPLQGQREAINAGTKDSLLFPPSTDPPVQVGEVFQLRTCGIEITKVSRITTHNSRYFNSWRAEFTRFERESKPFFLGPNGYTHDPDQAVRAQDNPDAETLDQVDPEAREEPHRAAGDPPEPEAVPPHEVGQLPSTVQAKLRHIQAADATTEQAVIDRQAKQLMRRLRKLQLDAAKYKVDLAPNLIGMIREAEQQVGEARRDAA